MVPDADGTAKVCPAATRVLLAGAGAAGAGHSLPEHPPAGAGAPDPFPEETGVGVAGLPQGTRPTPPPWGPVSVAVTKLTAGTATVVVTAPPSLLVTVKVSVVTGAGVGPAGREPRPIPLVWVVVTGVTEGISVMPVGIPVQIPGF